MPDFGLVSEGVTDHAVLTNILIGYFKGQREPDISREHPDPFAETPQGGWTLVIQYLREKRFRQSFQFNDYLIIQVDTDVSEDPGFDVPKQDANGPLSIEHLVSNVAARLCTEIGTEDWALYSSKFIFAIAVDQLECWVLPLWFSDNKGKQIANCTTRLGGSQGLRNDLTARSLRWITPGEKPYSSYDYASKGYRKPRLLRDEGIRNPSLSLFLEDLDRRQITLRTLE